MIARRPLPLLLATLLGLWACLPLAQAQVYRVIDPTGRVTYTDTPPPPDSKSSQVSVASSNVASLLPYELQQVVSRYPVTLYTTDNCTPCSAGRALLARRGIPYTERTVNTPQDMESFQRVSGQTGLPLLTLGTQHVKGFVESEWTQYLDAAGYPANSALPTNYHQPAATPLNPAKPAAKPASTAASTTTPPPPPTPRPTAPSSNGNSSNFRF